MEGSSSSSSFAVAALLTLVVFTAEMTPRSAARFVAGSTRSTQFIRTSCGATTYPRLCFNSLSGYASAIQASPKLLADTALSVALDHARSTSDMMLRLSRSRGMTPREVGAMRDCVEEIADSVGELQDSLDEMNHLSRSNIGLQMSDIQTWVSAALTDEDTCTDGFAGSAMNGNIKTAVRRRIVHMAHLTSNALALINSYASVQSASP